MFSDEQKYLVGLSHFPKFGPKRLKLLLEKFPGSAAAFHAPLADLVSSGLSENLATEFIQFRQKIVLEKILEKMSRENIGIISLADKSYPRLLKEIFDPPIVLYYKGCLENIDFNLAIVGSRKCTSYGRQCAESFAAELSRQGLNIVSGLALGIDTYVHEACLKNSGRTIAVLGSGIDNASLYPAINHPLAERIIQQGSLIFSEFPLGTEPLRYNFPQRNRIISGLSQATLVIEAQEKSGALITARFALEQNRELLAVPGNIFTPAAFGPNELIKQGAKLITKSDEVMEVFGLEPAKLQSFQENKKLLPSSREEEKLLPFISKEPAHINELVRLSGLDTATINSTLTIMEMKGMVRNLGNMQYVIV